MFQLALSLGCSVRELGERMSGRELMEWLAYARLDPFGEARADLRQAITSCVVANGLGGKQHQIRDFVPKFDEDEAQDPVAMKDALVMWARAWNAVNGDKPE